MRVFICCLGLVLAAPASANSMERLICKPVTLKVADMGEGEKLCRSLARALVKLPEVAAKQAGELLTPENLDAIVVMTALWMGSQGIPVVGQAVDAALLALSVVMVIAQAQEVARLLWLYANTARRARGDEQLDEAATALAQAITLGGVNLVSAIFTRRALAGSGSASKVAPLAKVQRGAASATAAVAIEHVPAATPATPAVVMMARQTPTAKPSVASSGPGQWESVRPPDSERARGYQEQVTGHSATQAYKVDGTEFDGFDGLRLQEAKGPGYESFFHPDGTPKSWFEQSGKLGELMEQAARQSKLAERYNLPLRWHVAEARVAEALRVLFKDARLFNIEVVHTPALPLP